MRISWQRRTGREFGAELVDFCLQREDLQLQLAEALGDALVEGERDRHRR
jgi:hypothetical protein